MAAPIMADCDSPHSSGDESDYEGSEQQPADEEPVPYPFLGRPYETNSILNSLDLELVKSAVVLITGLRFTCIELTVKDKNKHHSLSHMLFGSCAVAFSKTAANLRVVSCKKTLPLVGLLSLPMTDERKMNALGAINGFFSRMVADSGMDLLANKESVADVPTIIKALSSLTVPPWIIHQGCRIEKADWSCDVPHGKLDVVIGRPCPSVDLMTPPRPGIAVALIKEEGPRPLKSIAPVSGKVQVKLERPKSERQVVLELLAFAEVIRADGPVIMIKASKYTFRLYIYIRQLDLLFKSPTFNYNSTTSRKLRDSIKGLVVLHTVLNQDVKDYFREAFQNLPECYQGFVKCGWAKAVSESKAAYKPEMLIDKPGQSSTHSPSPTPEVETIEDESDTLIEFSYNYCRKKPRLAVPED